MSSLLGPGASAAVGSMVSGKQSSRRKLASPGAALPAWSCSARPSATAAAAMVAASRRSVDNARSTCIGAVSNGHMTCPSEARSIRTMYCGGILPENPAVKMTLFAEK
eukprot:15064557-Alexandrium_andersonii.AAC.2